MNQDPQGALHLLEERAILTSAVCRELELSDGDFEAGRPSTAAAMLWEWITARYGSEMGTSTRAGLERMTVPRGAEKLMREIVAGSEVCDTYAVMRTADTFSEMQRDKENLAADLARYRKTMRSLGR